MVDRAGVPGRPYPVELSVLRRSCRHCYYYGTLCAFGRGRLCSVLFRPGDPQRFVEREPCVRDILPDLLVPAIPVIGGVVLLMREFDWVLLLAVLATVLLATVGAGMVRGLLACPDCAQRELGCPAEQLFNRQRGHGPPNTGVQTHQKDGEARLARAGGRRTGRARPLTPWTLGRPSPVLYTVQGFGRSTARSGTWVRSPSRGAGCERAPTAVCRWRTP